MIDCQLSVTDTQGTIKEIKYGRSDMKANFKAMDEHNRLIEDGWKCLV